MQDYLGKDYPKLGFGLMRLPKMETDALKIDVEQVKVMVDKFIAAGFSYFDTAFVYDGGDSERAIKAALVDRYPRDRFMLASKLCAWMGCTDEKSAKQEFFTSLERTGAGFFDFYLLHALQSWNYQKYDDYGIWDFAAEQKAKGLIKKLGFSFHATPDLLDRLLTDHPEVDFVQLQLNYADWENPSVSSRANYEVALKHNKPFIVMEPIKGGMLANPPEDVKKILRAADAKASFASWAVRFAASLEGDIVVLSGMSNVAQMEDNISYMKDFKPLNDSEKETIRCAQEALAGSKTIPCTACHYCTAGCPKHISIPDVFSAMNIYLTYGDTTTAKHNYWMATEMKGSGKAGGCIACGQCERACPQQIKVITQLKRCSEILEE